MKYHRYVHQWKYLYTFSKRCVHLAALVFVFQCAGVYEIEPNIAKHSIVSITPDCGRTGDTLVIRGDKFSNIASENVVTLNGSRAVVIQASPTFLTAIVPARAGSGEIRVSINDAYVDGPSFTYFPTGIVTVAEADVSYAGGIDADASKDIFIARSGLNRIDLRTRNGDVIFFAGGGRAGNTPGYHDETGPFALFYNPADVAIDSKGNIYVSDTGNNCIRRITRNGVVTLYAGVYNPQFPSPQPGFKDGLRTEAYFDGPRGLAIDKDDNLYVCDDGNSRIRKITPDNGNAIGNVTTVAGNGNYGDQDGPAALATFSTLYDLVVDDEQNIFVTEELENPKIRAISREGIVSTIMIGSEQIYSGCNGEPYILGGAFGITLGPEGNLYCGVYAGTSDLYYTFSYKVITITPDRKIGILAGGGSPNGPFEGIGDKVFIPFASSIVQIDDALYVSANYQILKIDLN